MCGICGWADIAAGGAASSREGVIGGMNAQLRHRGPDQQGDARFANGAIAASRLRVIDLAGGDQPISSDDGRLWISFNGEIYNFPEIRRELERHGHRFRTHSDTEVVLRAYEQWGERSVERLRGMFAFCIAHVHPTAGNEMMESGRIERLFLARDPVGKKPLFFARHGSLLVFGSEIKAILQHPDVVRRLDPAVMRLYLTHGYVPAPQTMFRGIREVEPGTTLVVDRDGLRHGRHWEFPVSSGGEGDLTPYEIPDRLWESLLASVERRMISQVPVGAFLSGGIDSTGVVAAMREVVTGPVKTFAIGFSDEPSYNELDYARVAADALGTDHHEYTVRADAVDLLPRLVWHYDQPFADSSALATYLVSELARQQVTVVLTGDGGDELFAGYDRFLAALIAERYRSVIPFPAHAAVSRVLGLFPESTSYAGIVSRSRRFLAGARHPLSERYLEWVRIFPQTWIDRLLPHGNGPNPAEQYSAHFREVGAQDPLARLLYVNAKTYLPGDLLVKTDRMTMAHSLEARSPFLDIDLAQLAARVPSRQKIRRGVTKHALKKALMGRVPDAIIRRRKHGFGVPVGRWFRTSLRSYARDLLLAPDSRVHAYLDRAAIRRLLDEHQGGAREHGQRIWALLTLEIWHRTILEAGMPLERSVIDA